MEEIEVVVDKTRQIVSDIHTKASQDTTATAELYASLSSLLALANSSHVPIAQLVSTSTLSVLNDMLMSKYLLITYALQNAIVSIYKVIFTRETPGYIVRNIVTSLLAVCSASNRIKTVGSRESCLSLLGFVFEKRCSDCNGQVSDVVKVLVTYSKSSESWLRQIANVALVSMVRGCGSGMVEHYPELLKICTKYSTDRSPEVRASVSRLVKEVCRNAGLCALKYMEVYIPLLQRGIEDDVPFIQDEFAYVLAYVFYQLILEYIRQQVKIKIDQARGIDTDATPKKLSFQDRLVRPKKVLETYDFRSVLRLLLSSVVQSTGTLRIGYLCSLTYLVRITSAETDQTDFEWTVRSVLEVMEDPAVRALGSEEAVFFRSRVCFVLHSITSSLPEARQLLMASVLSLFLASMDARSDNSLHVALAELGNVVAVLGENATAVSSIVQAAATIHLHSSSFAVRSQAAYLLCALSISVPLIAVEILKQSLSNARQSVSQITSVEFLDKVEGIAPDGLTMKNPQVVKLLKKMFFFHGNVLVLSIILKNEALLPVGISSAIIFSVFDFGLELLHHDVLSSPVDLRQIVCNLVRAGSLLVSSCSSLGADIVKTRTKHLAVACVDMIKGAVTPSDGVTAIPASFQSDEAVSDELLYEMMVIESAIMALSSVFWYCPDAVLSDKRVLDVYIDCIDSAHRALPKFDKYKSHYRFRTMHVNIIECYAMLPTSAISSSLFSSAFQIFRNFTLAGVESEQFAKLAESKRVFEVLTTEGLSKPNNAKTIWKSLNNDILMLKLESNAYHLHLKESEASVAIFKNKFTYSYEKEINIKEYSPCARIESRSVDASITILAIIFASETKENQDKLIQFCCDSINQVLTNLNQGSTNLFASEDEKKRRLKLNLTTLRNAIFLFYSLVNYYSFPSSVSAYDPSLSWVHQIANSMIVLLNCSDYDIRITASYTISLLVYKMADFDITESIARKVLGFLTFVNESKADASKIDWGSYCGHFIVLSNMWSSVEKRFATKEDITKAVFGALKRIDSSYSFRAHALFALTIIASSKHKAEHLEKEAKLAFFETTFRIAEKHMLNISTVDDSAFFHEFDLVLCCVLRLVNVCVSVIAALYPHSSLIKRSWSLWRVIRSLSSHMNLVYESIEFLTLILFSSSGYLETAEVISFLNEVLQQQAVSCFNSRLQFGLVKVMDALIVADVDGSFEGGIHILLFKIIDRALASMSNSTQASYFGLEFKSDPSNEEFLIRNVIEYAESSLKKLAVAYCRRDPDTRAVHWFMFCRCICISGREAAAEKPSSMPVENAPVEDETATVSQTLEKEGVSTSSVDSHRQFVAWTMAVAVARAQELTNARSQLKCIALACATECIKELQNGSSLHSDVELARSTTDRLLESLDGLPSTSALLSLPCYASLFIEDMVALCCTCATYTVDDVQLSSLQIEALACLCAIVYFFKDTIDPESAASPLPACLILSQSISQIMSAIRPCLSTKYNTKLLSVSGSLICILTHHKFLEDKMLIRRLSKLMLPALGDASRMDEESVKSAVASADLADDLSASDVIVGLGLAARLFTLTQLTGYFSPSDDVKSVLNSIFEKHMDLFSGQWVGLVENAVVMVHRTQSWFSAEEMQVDLSYFSKTSGSKLVRRNLVAALPYLIVGSICSGKLDEKQTLLLLATLTSTVNESGLHRLISSADINNLKFTSLLGLIHIFDCKGISALILPGSWVHIIKKLLTTLKRNSFSGLELVNYCHMLLQLGEKLSIYLLDVELCDPASPFHQWLWLLHLNVFSVLLPQVLPSISAEDEQIVHSECFPTPLNRFDLAESAYRKSGQAKAYEVEVTMTLVESFLRLTRSESYFRTYAVQCVVSLLYWMSMFCTEHARVSDCIHLLAAFVKDVDDADFTASLRALLMQDLTQWHSIHARDKELPILSGNVCIPHAIVDLWCRLEARSPYLGELEGLVALISTSPPERAFIAKLLDAILLSLVKEEFESSKLLLAQSLFPHVITKLVEGGDHLLDMAFVKIALACFDLVQAKSLDVTAYMQIVIRSFLQLLRRRQDDAQLSLLCGLGLTRFAKSSPEAFKGVLVQLVEGDRALIQTVVKNAVILQSTQHDDKGGDAAARKTIDLARYKK